ncbi:MAG: hypothetical protein ACSHYA_16240 [Opitutaceae bacterium]
MDKSLYFAFDPIFCPKKTNALAAGMLQVVPAEESAESGVVVSEPVSSRRPVGVDEGRGQLMRSKARTEEEEATGGAL